MRREIQQMIEKLYKQYVKRKRWHKVVMALAAVVVFCTTYALVLPAITLETTCGIEEHIHVENCYEKVVSETTRTLACTYEFLGVHAHTSECYDSESNLLCGMVDYVVHEHNEDCMDENGSVVCQLPVIEKHEHTDACYKIPEVIKSTEASHVHDESCYTTERGELICQLEETEGYSHGESCYEQGELVCQLKEQESHVHGESCYEQENLVCQLNEQEEHTHVSECYEQILICERQEEEAHQHTDDCYEQISVLNCGMEEVVQSEVTVPETPEPELICTEPVVPEHIHEESCFVTETADDPLTCTLTENHTHNELCYGTWNLICGKEEHTHTDECQAMEGLGNVDVKGDEKLSASDVENVMLLDTADEETSVASAEEEIEGTIFAEGMLTDTAWWKIVDDEFGYRTLIIGGDGPMPDFSSGTQQPWREHRTTFDLIEIKDGITYIGKNAFQENYLSDLKIGTGVKTIEAGAFSYMRPKGNASVIVRIPGNVESVVGGVFSYSSPFKEIIFEEGVKRITGNTFTNITLYGNNLERVYFPASLTEIGYFGAGTYCCGVKTEFVVAEDNPVLYTQNGALYRREVDSKTGKEKITLIGYPFAREETKLEISGIDAIAPGIFSYACNLTEVSISGTEERPIVIDGSGLFMGNHMIEKITFNEYVNFSNTYRIFEDTPSLKSITITDGATDRWYSSFVGASALTEFTISSSIHYVTSSAFKNTYALENLIYDAQIGNIQSGAFGTNYYPRFDLVIGEHVDVLREGYNNGTYCFSTIAERAKSVAFRGENQITIDQGALKGAGEPLNNLSGKVWVDNQGVVYQYEVGNPNAKVVYVSPGITNITIPETITVENQVYTINSIGKNAFKASNVTNLTIANPGNISTVEDYAFANCVTLDIINGQTTVENAKGIFTQTLPNDNAFIGTALERDTSGDGNGTIEIEEKGDIFVFVADSTDSDAKLTVSTKKRQYYTGEQGITTISLSNPEKNTIQNKKFRIYFSASDSEIARDKKETFNIDGIGIINPIPISVINTETPGTYYFEIDGKDIGSSTFSFNQTHTYPSPDSDGGELKIWIEVHESEEGTTETPGDTTETPDDTTISNERIYQKLSWVTKAADPDVLKINNDTPILSASREKEIAEVHNLSYKVTATVSREMDGGLENCGQDFVRKLEFEDTLDIPENFYINPEIASAIQQGNYSYRAVVNSSNNIMFTQLYVKIDGVVYEICRIASTGKLENLTASIKDGNLKVHWMVRNTSQNTEITSDTYTITYGDEIICASRQVLSELEDKFVEFPNNVNVSSYYTYLKTSKNDFADATQTVEIKDATVTLVKENPIKPKYMGEDCQYKITLSNTTAFPYEDMGILKDVLDSSLYIKAEQLDEMFSDKTTGDKLNVVIKNVSLSAYKGGTADAADGSGVTLSPENTGVNTGYQFGMDSVEGIANEINIGWINNVLTMTVSGTENAVYTIGKSVDNNFESIEAAMNAIGFFVNTQTIYEVRWDYSDVILNGNTEFIHLIPANVKDSFMLLSKDLIREYILSSESITISKNYARLYRHSDSGAEIANAEVSNISGIKRESIVEKRAFHNGKEVDDNFQVNDKDVLEYSLDFIHYGNADYDVLPMTDLLSGGQVLLVPKEKNSSILGNKNLNVYGDEGTGQFYVLTAGNYENIWITENMLADSIKVTSVEGGGLQTLIKFYYKDLLGGKTYRKTLTYKALISLEYTDIDSQKFSLSNTVWANDHQGHRLYDPITGNGSIIRFEKEIVKEKGDSPINDVIAEDDYSIIAPGDIVTYRLKLYSLGNGAIELTGNQIYDALPNNGKSFTWGDENNQINISYYYDDGVQIANGKNWIVSNLNSDGEEEEAGQQYIRWNDDFKISFSDGGQVAYIYVSLQFPNTDNGWESYFQKINGKLIENTLFVNDMTSRVFHELGATGQVLLQKGVAKISARKFNINTGAWSNEEYISDTKELYQNTDSYAHVITYYTVLYNSGKIRLYLNDLMDELPEGFSFESLTNTMNVIENKTKKLDSTESAANGWKELVSITEENNGTIRFVPVSVEAVVKDGEDGHQRVNFKITDDGNNLSYDEVRKKYYLNPGEAIRFGYLVSTGKAKENVAVEEDAVNTIAMPYDNYMGLGVVPDQETKVYSAISQNDIIKPNAGNRELWTNPAAGSHGFQQLFTDQWLASQVTLKKESIKPGIIKNAKSRISAADGKINSYEGSANPTDTVIWDVKAVNDGKLPINYYMISDMMELPYRFIGAVGLSIYDGQDEDANRCMGHNFEYLFNITGRNIVNGQTVLDVQSNNSTIVQKLTVGTVGTITDVSIKGSTNTSNDAITTSIKVLIEEVEDEKGLKYEKISLIFDGKRDDQNVSKRDELFSIPSGGMAVLNVSTKNVPINNMPITIENRTYVNHAYITPLTQNFDKYHVTKGVYGIWNDEKMQSYVRNSALLTVSEGYHTIATKKVYEKDNVDNKAEGNNSSILLPDKESTFTYKLTVQLPDTQINYITLIDNLPYPDNPNVEGYTGDTMAYAPSVPRDSKFTVQLAENPNFRVTLTEKDAENGQILLPSQFKVSYHTKHNGFTMEDKSGSGENWVPFVYDNEKDSWGSEVTQDVGSIRLFINNIDHDNNLIKNQSKVTLEFDAKIVGDAEPGEIAWNSFGYSYEVSTTPYSSESDVVGVRVPAIPKLRKMLVTNSGKPYNADHDETFEFLIYSGSPLDLTNKTDAEINNMLQEEGRAVTYQQLTVNEGDSESEWLILNNIHSFTYSEEAGWTEGTGNWNWTEGTTYTVFELPQDSSSYYRHKNLLIQGNSGNAFTYNKNENCLIQAVNERKAGNLTLMKQDKDNLNIFLEGAVFVLYSPLKDDLMTVDAISKQLTDCNISGIGISDINTQISVAKPSGTSIGTSSGIPTETTTDTYYLASIQKTDSNGKITWKELYGEVYYIQELQAPAGYNLDSSLHKVTIDFNAKEQIVGITNEAGYALPESGGSGVNGLTIGGAALILTATAGVIGNNRKISKKRKKGGER